jgi:hypothetical protein
MDLAKKYLSLGAAASALNIYEELEMVCVSYLFLCEIFNFKLSLSYKLYAFEYFQLSKV